KSFRQLGSPCAGHPELGDAAGIEMTTGPLGQGVGTSVGMAMAANWLSARYDRQGFDLFGYNVYALCSDGDVMEGVGCEAASLAGHLKLGISAGSTTITASPLRGRQTFLSARTWPLVSRAWAGTR
ncbi:MAG: hypothetical protein VB817_13850, partial [Pirellulaceae bacterium]